MRKNESLYDSDWTKFDSMSGEIKCTPKIDALHFEVGSRKSEVGSLKLEVGSLKSEVWSLKSEVWSRKSEVWSRKSEVGSRKSEVGSRKSEVGSRKSEVGSRKSEVGSRKSEVGSRKSEVGSPSSAFVVVQLASNKTAKWDYWTQRHLLFGFTEVRHVHARCHFLKMLQLKHEISLIFASQAH